jgi:hypothetical protein
MSDDNKITMADTIDTVEQGIGILRERAQTLAEGARAGQSAQVLIPLATQIRSVLDQTLEKAKPIREMLPKGTLPAFGEMSNYLEASVRAIEMGKPGSNANAILQTQALLDTVEGLL